MTRQTHEATLAKSVPAPRDRVFHSMTDSPELQLWWGPQATAEVDLRPGGLFRLAMLLPNGASLVAKGTYQTVQIPARLDFTWAWEGEEGETLVTMLFHDRGEETEVAVTHTGFSDPETAANHVQGWSDCLDRLVFRYSRP